MKKLTIINLIDLFFKSMLLFFLNLIWTLYFIQVGWLCVILSLITSIGMLILIEYRKKKKTKRTKPLLEEQNLIENITNTFIYMPQNLVVAFFNNMLQKDYKTQVHKNYLSIESTSPIILYPYFKNENLNSDKLIEIYNSISPKKFKRLIILTNKYNPNVLGTINNFKNQVLILDNKQTYYNFCNKFNCYPKLIVFNKPQPKNTYKQLLAIAFNKKKTKGYALSALFIVFSSIFVTYKIYYLIVASILIIFAILSQFQFNFNKIQEENILN